MLWTSPVALFTPGPGQRVGLSVRGPTIGAYIEGSVVPASVLTDTAIATGTFWFDSVKVWELAA